MNGSPEPEPEYASLEHSSGAPICQIWGMHSGAPREAGGTSAEIPGEPSGACCSYLVLKTTSKNPLGKPSYNNNNKLNHVSFNGPAGEASPPEWDFDVPK